MPSKKPAGQKETKGAAAPARAAKKAAPQPATKGGAAPAPKARTGAKVSTAGKASEGKSASKAPAKLAAVPAKSKAVTPKSAPAKAAAKAPATKHASPKTVSKSSTPKPRAVQEVLALETTKAAAPQRAAANTPPVRRSTKGASGTRRASARRDPKETVPSERFSPLEKTSKRKAEAIREIDGPVSRSTLLEGELPGQYGVDRLVAMPKDPEWTHLYWEISPETQQKIASHAEGSFHVRGFDTTNILFDGSNAPVSLDIEVAPYARSWYVRLPYQGRVYTFEYGLADSRGDWKPLARSQPVGYHPGMSDLGNEEWISIASEELFRLSAGLDGQEGISDLIRRLRERSMPGSWGGASEVLSGRGGAFWLTSWGSGMGRLEFAPSSWMTSPMGSGTSWGSKGAGVQVPGKKGKDFWLWVETELILYGATEPDAKVTVRGEPIQLSPDGTFWMKFPFPDGTNYLLDVQAIDRDGDQVRRVAPAAKRWTE